MRTVCFGLLTGDINELYRMKLRPGSLAAFSEDCLGMNKRITFMQVSWSLVCPWLSFCPDIAILVGLRSLTHSSQLL